MRAVDAQKNVEYLKSIGGGGVSGSKGVKSTMEKMEARAETTNIDPIFLKAYGV